MVTSILNIMVWFIMSPTEEECDVGFGADSAVMAVCNISKIGCEILTKFA